MVYMDNFFFFIFDKSVVCFVIFLDPDMYTRTHNTWSLRSVWLCALAGLRAVLNDIEYLYCTPKLHTPSTNMYTGN